MLRAHPVAEVTAYLRGRPSPAYRGRLGAEGEKRVAAELDRWLTGGTWRMWHSLPKRPGELDHLVISTRGIAAIDAKHHAQRTVRAERAGIWVDGGRRTGYLKQARAHADWVQRPLHESRVDLPVQPVVAVVGGALQVKEGAPGVDVISDLRLGKWLRRKRAVLPRASYREAAQVVEAHVHHCRGRSHTASGAVSDRSPVAA